MIGFLFGTLCLVGLIKVARHGCGYGHCGGYGGPFGRRHGYRRGGGFGHRFFLRTAFERLDTTPGQEKVIIAAIDELRGVLRKAKDDFRATRPDFANVIRGEQIDEASVSDIFLKHDTTISEARRGVVEALRKIHDALSPEQREQVAEVIEKGPRFGGGYGRGYWGGPYRGQWA